MDIEDNHKVINRPLKNVSIKNKLFFSYGILFLIFVTTLSTVSYLNSTRIITDKSVNYALGMLEQIRNNIDINLEQIDLVSYVVFSNNSMLKVLKNSDEYFTSADSALKYSIDKLLADVVFSRRDIYSITIFDNKGRRIDTNPYSPNVPFEEVKKKAVEKDGKMAWLSTDKKFSLIPIVRQIRDMDMNPVGFMQINIRESSFNNICSEQIKNMNGLIFIENENGSIISGNDSTYIGTQINEKIYEKTKLKEPGYIIDYIDNVKSIVAFYPSRVNGWQCVGIIPMNKVTADAELVRNIILISSVIAIILFIILSYYLARGVTNPLKIIAGEMKNANISDWTPKVSFEGKDEVAYLSREFNRMVVRINDLVDEAVEQKSRFSRQELKALQSQISPHFLYNTLEIVNWMARTRDVPEIVEIVKALSDMMRYITSHSEEIVTVEKELEYLKMYCLIQKYRYKDKFTVFYEVEDDILDFCLPKLTLQPIIENAIVHAFNGVRREGKIIITGNIVGDRVRLQIIDNGKGIDNAQIESMLKNENISSVPNHVGIGVSNVNQRIKLIYGNEFGLQIKSVLNEGTQFDIWIPIGG